MDLRAAWRDAWAFQQAAFTSHCHGIDHWVRVERNGLWLARQVPGVDELVVRLFAALHDSRRQDDGRDIQHGPRAAASLAGLGLRLDSGRLALLDEAIRTHSFGHTRSEDPTVRACHDADRLDLGRVGRRPDPAFLNTEPARDLAARDACESLDRESLPVTLPESLRPTPRWDGRR